jgi:nucleoside-diphosphate-sugar epimerase
MNILITGATGFIGSNIASKLVEMGHEVYATYRSASSFQRCINFKDRVHWLNTDLGGWKDQIINLKPDQLIHAAWDGISASERDEWDIQMSNYWLAKEYINLSLECEVKKIIAFGTQAEYGKYDFPVKETTLALPEDAYGAVKNLTVNYLRNACDTSDTQWYWIRIFSVFGEGENPDWLIPTVISKLLKKEPVPLTFCDQVYNYLYIEEFVNQLITVINCKEDKSGIYNLCNSRSIVLKDLLLKISGIIDVPGRLLHFGELPYRPGQKMRIEGDNTKFRNCFNEGAELSSDLAPGLMKTIEFYRNN